MPGLGTIINTAAILLGGLLGLTCGKWLQKDAQDTLCRTCGIATMFLGIAGAMEGMLSVSGSGIVSGNSMLLILSLALGALIGELLRIEDRFEALGIWLREKTGNAKDPKFVDAFVTASLTVCIGAMAIVGAVQDGISHDPSVLTAKAVLDLIIIMVMTSSMGKGCAFSALPVALWQGSITALSGLLRPILTDGAMANLSMVGSVLIFCVGVNLVWGKRLKVANMLPSVFLAAAAALIF